jgi:hypothetical protein
VFILSNIDTADSRKPTGEKVYYIGGSITNANVAMGENIQQIFVGNPDGQFLFKQFKNLMGEIESSDELEPIVKDLALKKTENVAQALAKVEKSPIDLQRSLVDANLSFSGKTGWIWERIKSIMTSEAAKNTLKEIAQTAIGIAIKTMVGV